MSADEVLMRQAEIARSDIGEFLEQAEDGEVSVRLTDAKTNERKQTHLIKRITQRKVVRTVKDMTETEITLTLELHDAQAAQVQLFKTSDGEYRIGLLSSGDSYEGGINRNVTKGELDQAERLAARIHEIGGGDAVQARADATIQEIQARRKAIEMLDRVGIPQPDRRVEIEVIGTK